MSLSIIGDNNKSLRRTHNLTQPEFEKTIRIFCNSLIAMKIVLVRLLQYLLIENVKNLVCQMLKL